LAVGLAVVVAYALLATVSGRLSPLARRPLLDGFAPPPPYHFVTPPPDLASSNKPPSAGRFTINLDPTTGSEPKVVATKDFQASLALSPGAIAPRPGDSSVLVTMTPLPPGASLVVGSGLSLVGNVYRFTAVYRPSGTPVARFRGDAQLVLAYPLRSHSLVARHTLMRSADQQTWTSVLSADSIVEQLVQGTVRELGYFAVGQSAGETPASSGSPGRVVLTVVLWAAVVGVVILFLLAELRRRRTRARSTQRGAAQRRPQPKKRGRDRRADRD